MVTHKLEHAIDSKHSAMQVYSGKNRRLTPPPFPPFPLLTYLSHLLPPGSLCFLLFRRMQCLTIPFLSLHKSLNFFYAVVYLFVLYACVVVLFV
ncbi:MAG: hypothetical protein JOS17DRAFT_728606 [Linnemannia elongata]|nr:MAG: hypothetical protein JOS17DRAFT_728606 [Linnemannia elongata]